MSGQGPVVIVIGGKWRDSQTWEHGLWAGTDSALAWEALVDFARHYNWSHASVSLWLGGVQWHRSQMDLDAAFGASGRYSWLHMALKGIVPSFAAMTWDELLHAIAAPARIDSGGGWPGPRDREFPTPPLEAPNATK